MSDSAPRRADAPRCTLPRPREHTQRGAPRPERAAIKECPGGSQERPGAQPAPASAGRARRGVACANARCADRSVKQMGDDPARLGPAHSSRCVRRPGGRRLARRGSLRKAAVSPREARLPFGSLAGNPGETHEWASQKASLRTTLQRSGDRAVVRRTRRSGSSWR